MISIIKMQTNLSYKSTKYINYNLFLCSNNSKTFSLFTENCISQTVKVLMTWMHYWFHLISLVTKDSSSKLFSLWMAFGRLCAESFSSGYPFYLFLYACFLKEVAINNLILNTTCFPLCSNFGSSTYQSDLVSQNTCTY